MNSHTKRSLARLTFALSLASHTPVSYGQTPLPLVGTPPEKQNGSSASHLKTSDPTRDTGPCRYGGKLNTAAFVRELMASKQSVWLSNTTPYQNGSGQLFTEGSCGWAALESVAKTWARSLPTPCTEAGCNPIVYANLNNEDLRGISASIQDVFKNYFRELKKLHSDLPRTPVPPERAKIRLGVSIDDAQSLILTSHKPDGLYTPPSFGAALKGAMNDIYGTSGVRPEFSPYFEAGNAMALFGDAYLLGVPPAPSSVPVAERAASHRFGYGGALSLTFQWREGSGSSLPPTLPDGTFVDLVFTDVYEASTQTSRRLFADISVGGASPVIRRFDLSEGALDASSGTVTDERQRYHSLRYELTASDRSAYRSSSGFQITVTLKGRESGAPDQDTLTNLRRTIVLGSPMMELPITPSHPRIRASFSELAAANPTLFTTSVAVSPTGVGTSYVAKKIPVEEKLMDLSSGTRRVDGLFFKTDSSPLYFDPATEALMAENICRAPRLLSTTGTRLPCRSMTWGSTNQLWRSGEVISPQTEAKRYIAISPYVDGMVVFNHSMDLAAPNEGLFKAHKLPESAAPNHLGVFVWPYDTRSILGWSRTWTWRVPSSYGGEELNLEWSQIPRGSLTDGNPAPLLSDCTIRDASTFTLTGTESGVLGTTDLVARGTTPARWVLPFTPSPGEILSLKSTPLTQNIGSANQCMAQVAITGARGDSDLTLDPDSSTDEPSDVRDVVAIDNPNEIALYECIRYLFQNPATSRLRDIPSGVCPL